MKCGCVTGSTLMARFDLNHPYMLQNDSDELCCATMNALPSKLPKLAELSGQTQRDLWTLLPPPTCTHHGNAWKTAISTSLPFYALTLSLLLWPVVAVKLVLPLHYASVWPCVLRPTGKPAHIQTFLLSLMMFTHCSEQYEYKWLHHDVVVVPGTQCEINCQSLIDASLKTG